MAEFKSLDAMLAFGAQEMDGDPWMGSDAEHMQGNGLLQSSAAWHELANIRGEIHYKGRIFLVTHRPGHRGMGGMDEGSPPSVRVYLISQRTGKD